MTTGVERLTAAVTGKPADRIPVFCNMFDQGARELNMPLKDYYSKGEYVAEAQLWMRDRFGYDNVWSVFYAGKEAELFGSHAMRFAPDGPPNVEDFVIQSDADISRIEVPTNILNHPGFREQRSCMEILTREAKGKHVICAYVTGTMSLPPLLMGMDKWMELLFLGDPGLREEMLAKSHDFLVQEALAYRELGADLIVYTNPLGSTDFVPMKYFLEHSLPWIEKDMQAIGTEGVVYYGGGARIDSIIEPTRERTGIGIWYLSPLDDLAEAKHIVGTTGLTCGSINDIKLMGWSKYEIRQEVKRLLAEGMPGGPYLFGTGMVPYNVPDESITVMLEAVYEFGRLNGDAAP
jgi:uroporphyrinogen-III decarboxylase